MQEEDRKRHVRQKDPFVDDEKVGPAAKEILFIDDENAATESTPEKVDAAGAREHSRRTKQQRASQRWSSDRQHASARFSEARRQREMP